ncbi:MAG: type II toxin-antitoxin system prevent-host-death family antitoxin [Treponema sp.]|nr:type II toxin-antitoxin system prevent-host-death family antitoxin [Treponema sp.]
MVVTATQFKSNIGHYLDAVSDKKEVYITKNGKMAAKLSDPMLDKMSILNALVGILPPDHISLEDAKMERILKRAFPGEDTYVVNKRLESGAQE